MEDYLGLARRDIPQVDIYVKVRKYSLQICRQDG